MRENGAIQGGAVSADPPRAQRGPRAATVFIHYPLRSNPLTRPRTLLLATVKTATCTFCAGICAHLLFARSRHGLLVAMTDLGRGLVVDARPM